VIEIKGLRFRYGEGGFPFCLRIEELTINRGETVAFIGPSGSGKTTLVFLIAGILTPQAGTIRVNGAELSNRSDEQRRDFRISKIGFIFQEFELLDYLVARENILLPFYLNRSLQLTPQVRADAQRLAAAMRLTEQVDRRPGVMSQGERQRVAICRAMITHPELLIADEPTGNLDPPTARSIIDLLFREVDRLGVTLITVTHNHALLESFDRVVDMQELTSGADE